MTPKKDFANADEPANSLKNQGESLEYSDSSSTTVISPGKSSKSNSAGTVVSPQPAESSRNDTADEGNVRMDPALTNAVTPGKPVRPKRYPLKAVWERTNIYLLLFILIIFILVALIAGIYFKNRSNSNQPETTINTQKLSPETLEELANSGLQVGDPKQVLNVQSNSVFAGTVLVKGEMQVAGGLKIGSGSLNIPDMNIGGTALINDLQTKTLAVASNTAIQGSLSVQQNLIVNGSGSFNGALTAAQLTVNKLQLSGDLNLTRHLVAGGSIPGRVNGSALGTGGTSSNSGSDTAGTIIINTGSGTVPGCLVTVNFAQPFTSTPHISITPVGTGAASMEYYINRTTTNFTICSLNAPPANVGFAFDYIALD